MADVNDAAPEGRNITVMFLMCRRSAADL